MKLDAVASKNLDDSALDFQEGIENLWFSWFDVVCFVGLHTDHAIVPRVLGEDVIPLLRNVVREKANSNFNHLFPMRCLAGLYGHCLFCHARLWTQARHVL